MTISRRLRFEILRRDGHTCRYCGASAPDATLHLDHVVPAALGGGDEPSNLVTACVDCNNGKGSTSPDAQIVADVDETAIKYALALKRVAEIRRAELGDVERELDAFEQYWEDINGSGHYRRIGEGDAWESKVLNMVDNGLSWQDLADFARLSIGANKPWRYFYTIAWAEVTKRQQLAAEMVRDER